MSTVKSALAQKGGALVHVRSGDMVVEALRQMRDNQVRSVLVIDDDVLVGIVTQGDCAIKVLLPGLDAKQTPVSQVMTGNPVTIKPDDRLEGCMAMMAGRGFRHLPVLDAGKVIGVISIGDVVKDIIRELELNVGDLMGFIMRDGPGGLTDEPRRCRLPTYVCSCEGFRTPAARACGAVRRGRHPKPFTPLECEAPSADVQALAGIPHCFANARVFPCRCRTHL